MAPKPVPAAARFSAKWQRDATTGCHVWTAATVGSGYGCFYTREVGRQVLAHRYSYEQAKGPIPNGLHIDHLCRNKRCVNPDHLEAVSHQENHRRVGWTANTHCKRGHEMSADNVYVRPSGARRCRECERRTSKAWAAARYEPRSIPNPPAGLLSLAFV